MHPSIPEGSWRVNADDPLARTRLLDLPDLRVTRLEYNNVQHWGVNTRVVSRP